VVSAARSVLIRTQVVTSVPMIRQHAPNVTPHKTSSSMMANAEISAPVPIMERRSKSRLLEAQKPTPVKLPPTLVV